MRPGVARFAAILAVFFIQCACAQDRKESVGIAIHGGAGPIDRAELSAETEADLRATLGRTIRAGHDVLTQGGNRVDAVRAAVTRPSGR